jgi:hypothetical protein
MIQLLYTNSATPNAPQPSASASIGGYISSSSIPNDFLSNIFSEISALSKESNRKETILIALKNISQDTLDELTFSFELPQEPYINVKVAFTLPSLDSCGEPIFEKIPNSSAIPLNANFLDVVNGSDFVIGDIASNQIVGIWFTRTLSDFAKNIPTCEELSQQQDAEKEQVINMNISWGENSVSNS